MKVGLITSEEVFVLFFSKCDFFDVSAHSDCLFFLRASDSVAYFQIKE